MQKHTPFGLKGSLLEQAYGEMARIDIKAAEEFFQAYVKEVLRERNFVNDRLRKKINHPSSHPQVVRMVA